METNEACDNRIYLLSGKVVYVLLSNLCFLVMISPCILYFFISGTNLSIPILTFLGILIGPALATMFTVTRKLMLGQQERAIKDYFYYYRLNLIQGIFVATILNLILMISYIDIQYFFSINAPLIAYLFVIAALFIIALSIYLYPILGRINAKTIDLFKLSIKLVIKKVYLTLSCLSALIIAITIIKFTGTSLIAILFGTSGICYFILRLLGNVFNEAETYLKEKYSKQ